MAHITILVTGIAAEEGLLHIAAIAQVSPGSAELSVPVNVPWDASAATINAAILAAAITAAEAENLTIGPTDTKILLSAAIDL